MCDLDRAGTKGVIILGVEDSRQREVMSQSIKFTKFCLRSLVGVLGGNGQT